MSTFMPPKTRNTTMRNRLVGICLVASALLLTPSAGHAQQKKPVATAAKGGDKKGDKQTPKEIQLDDAAEEGPATAGQMTEEAAQGKRLFDAERWSEAALVLKRVVDG